MEQRPVTVALVGAGNVATHLARALVASGCRIVTVSARTPHSAQRLAAEVGAAAVPVSQADTGADYVIVAVSDTAVPEAVAALPGGRAIVVHTSGSVPMEAVTAAGHRGGVLYPLQTFSRDVAVDVADVPFFNEGDSPGTLALIDALARRLSLKVYHADSQHRRALHIAGVLTSNFPVYLLELSRRVLADAGFPLEVVRPLAEATVAKAFAVGPRDALTGPARRGDLGVTSLQAAALPPAARAIYQAITDAIIDDYHHHHEQD